MDGCSQWEIPPISTAAPVPQPPVFAHLTAVDGWVFVPVAAGRPGEGSLSQERCQCQVLHPCVPQPCHNANSLCIALHLLGLCPCAGENLRLCVRPTVQERGSVSACSLPCSPVVPRARKVAFPCFIVVLIGEEPMQTSNCARFQ